MGPLCCYPFLFDRIDNVFGPRTDKTRAALDTDRRGRKVSGNYVVNPALRTTNDEYEGSTPASPLRSGKELFNRLRLRAFVIDYD